VLIFVEWARSVNENPVSFSALDDLVTDFIHELFLRGGKRYLAADALYGLIWLIPALRNQLPLSVRSVEGWGRRMPTVSYPPMPRAVAAALAVTLLKNNFPAHALGVLVSFDGYLRVGELADVRLSDVVIPEIRLTTVVSRPFGFALPRRARTSLSLCVLGTSLFSSAFGFAHCALRVSWVRQEFFLSPPMTSGTSCDLLLPAWVWALLVFLLTPFATVRPPAIF
jgi:hypothetical protein